jgi:hypothetical protein
LEDGEEFQLKLPKRTVDRFHDISKCEGEKYFIPWASNYACVDSYLKVSKDSAGYLFQMTVSKKHPINNPKLLDIIRKTKLKDLYFVVPQNLFDQFQKQRLDEPTSKKDAALKVDRGQVEGQKPADPQKVSKKDDAPKTETRRVKSKAIALLKKKASDSGASKDPEATDSQSKAGKPLPGDSTDSEAPSFPIRQFVIAVEIEDTVDD